MKEVAELVISKLEQRVADKTREKERNIIQIAQLNQIENLEQMNDVLEIEISFLTTHIENRQNEPE